MKWNIIRRTVPVAVWQGLKTNIVAVLTGLSGSLTLLTFRVLGKLARPVSEHSFQGVEGRYTCD